MGQIKVTKCPIEGLYVIEPTVHGDNRGFFMEVFNEHDLKEHGLHSRFVQENQSMSEKGTLRGLHFQNNFPQCKLCRVLRGRVFDVAVDLRKGSETFGKWYGLELSEDNKKMFLVPEGFAHGLLSLSDGAVFCYKCSDFYHPGDEYGIPWNDPVIGIKWPGIEDSGNGHYRLSDGTPLKISEKDHNWPSFLAQTRSLDESTT